MDMQTSCHLVGLLVVGGGREAQLCGDTAWSLPKTAPGVDRLSLWLAFSRAGCRQRARAKTSLRVTMGEQTSVPARRAICLSAPAFRVAELQRQPACRKEKFESR